GLNHDITQGIAGPLAEIWNLQRLPLADRVGQGTLDRSDVKPAEACEDLLVESSSLAELEFAALFAIVEDRTCVGAGELDRTLHDGLQHDLQLERRAYRPPDLAECGEISVARLHLLEQPRVLDGDHRLVGEGPQQFNLSVGKWAHLASL